MICLQRTSDDLHAPVPGCQGFPAPGADFCYEPDDSYLKPQEMVNNGVRLRRIDCSPWAPCNACEGGEYLRFVFNCLQGIMLVASLPLLAFADCDKDEDCFGGNLCFLRGRDDPTAKVPGCIGEGVPGKLLLLTFALIWLKGAAERRRCDSQAIFCCAHRGGLLL